MDIIVCVKAVLDPDLPPAKFRIEKNQAIPPEGMPPVINPYDGLAVEAALRMKEAKKEGKITSDSRRSEEGVGGGSETRGQGSIGI